jgi:Protein of unknown function (DUF3306)
MADEPDTPFLSRWVHRKQQAKRTPEKRDSPEASEAVAGVALPVADRAPEAAPEPAFDPATLPKVEDLTAESDITAFLRKGVPDELKRLALRRVWSLDPQIRDFIEVAENQYDWNAVDGVPGFGALPEGTDIQTLLAQATGQLQKAVEPSETVASKEAGQAEAAGSHVTSPQERPEDAASSVRGDAAERPIPSSGAVPPPDIEPARRITRRRHGGALPG